MGLRNATGFGLVSGLSHTYFRLSVLTETWFVYTNGFSGDLPAEMGDLQSLQQFRAHENFFEGELPGSLFDLASLRVLRLDANSLSGEISPGIGDLTKLRTLRLEFNFFTGPIPEEIGQLTELGKGSRNLIRQSQSIIELTLTFFPLISRISSLKRPEINKTDRQHP